MCERKHRVGDRIYLNFYGFMTIRQLLKRHSIYVPIHASRKASIFGITHFVEPKLCPFHVPRTVVRYKIGYELPDGTISRRYWVTEDMIEEADTYDACDA